MNNILVVNRMGIGDVVLTTPLAQAIKQHIPHARVGFVVASKSLDLLQNHPYIDHVFAYQKQTRFAMVKQINANGYTDAVIVDDRLSSSILAWRAGCKLHNVGKVISIFGRRWCNSKREKPTAIQHYTEYMKYLYEDYNYQYISPVVGGITDEENNKITNWVKKNKSKVGKKILVVPRGVTENKNWPVQYFGEVNQYLNSKGIIPIYTGSKNDREYINSIDGEKNNIAGEFNLRELAALSKAMDACITVCTGPMHIIGTTKIPMIALYGPTNPSYWAPRHATIVKADNSAYESNHSKHDCMKRLTPEMVITQINHLLQIQH